MPHPQSLIEPAIQVDPQRKMNLARRAYEAFHRLARGSCSESQVTNSSAGIEGWWTCAQTLESRKPGREDVVRSGVLKGMVCSSVQEARMVEQLSERKAGFRAECDEQDATGGVDSMIDHIGR